MEFVETDSSSSTRDIISSIKGDLRNTPQNIDTVLQEVDKTVSSVETQLSYVRHHHINNTLSVILNEITVVKTHVSFIENKTSTTFEDTAMKPSQKLLNVAVSTGLKPQADAEVDEKPKTYSKTDIFRDINHNVKSISDIKIARRHFHGPEGVTIDADSMVVILDTEKPGTTYKFPIVRPQFRQPTRLLKRLNRIHLKLNCGEKPPVINDDYIELSDSELVNELDREYSRLVADCEAGIGVFNSPNRIIKLVDDSDSAESLHEDVELMDQAEVVDSEVLSDIVPLPQTPTTDIWVNEYPNFCLEVPVTGDLAASTVTEATALTFITGSNVEDKLRTFNSEVPKQASPVLEELNCADGLVDSKTDQNVDCMKGCAVFSQNSLDLVQFNVHGVNSNCSNLVDYKADNQNIDYMEDCVFLQNGLNTDLAQFSAIDGNSNINVEEKQQRPHTINMNALECRLPAQLICDQSANIPEDKIMTEDFELSVGSVNFTKDGIVNRGFNSSVNCAQTIESNFQSSSSYQDERKDENSLDNTPLKYNKTKIDPSKLCNHKIHIISNERVSETAPKEAPNFLFHNSFQNIKSKNASRVERSNFGGENVVDNTTKSSETATVENDEGSDEVIYIDAEKGSIYPENYLEQRQVNSFGDDTMVIDLTDSDELINIKSVGTEGAERPLGPFLTSKQVDKSSATLKLSQATVMIDDSYSDDDADVEVEEILGNNLCSPRINQDCMVLKLITPEGVHQPTEDESPKFQDMITVDSDDEVIYTGITKLEKNILNQANASSEMDTTPKNISTEKEIDKSLANELCVEVETFFYIEDSCESISSSSEDQAPFLMQEDSKPFSITSEVDLDEVIYTDTIVSDKTCVENVSSKITSEELSNATEATEVIYIDAIKEETNVNKEIKSDKMEIDRTSQNAEIKSDEHELPEAVELINEADLLKTEVEIKVNPTEDFLMENENKSEVVTPDPDEVFYTDAIAPDNTCVENVSSKITSEELSKATEAADLTEVIYIDAIEEETSVNKEIKSDKMEIDLTPQNGKVESDQHVKLLEAVELINEADLPKTEIEIKLDQIEDFLMQNETKSEVVTPDPDQVFYIDAFAPDKTCVENVLSKITSDELFNATDATDSTEVIYIDAIAEQTNVNKDIQSDKMEIDRTSQNVNMESDEHVKLLETVELINTADSPKIVEEIKLNQTEDFVMQNETKSEVVTPDPDEVFYTDAFAPDKTCVENVSAKITSQELFNATEATDSTEIVCINAIEEETNVNTEIKSDKTEIENAIMESDEHVELLEVVELINEADLPNTVDVEQTEDVLMQNENKPHATSEVAPDGVVCINSTEPKKGSEKNESNRVLGTDHFPEKMQKEVNESHIEQSLELSESLFIIDDADSSFVAHVKTADLEKNTDENVSNGVFGTDRFSEKMQKDVHKQFPDLSESLIIIDDADSSDVTYVKPADLEKNLFGTSSLVNTASSVPDKPHTVISEESSTNIASSTALKADPNEAKPSTAELKTTPPRTKRPAEGSCSKPAKRAKFICPTSEINLKILDVPEPASDSRWHLMDLTEPEDCFMAVCNQWNCPPPDPHEDLTLRYLTEPSTTKNYFLPGSKQKLLEGLSIYDEQLRNNVQQSQALKFALDNQGWAWNRRKINKALEELKQLDHQHSTLTRAWNDSYKLYKHYKTSKYEPLYISEHKKNEALRHLEMMNAYKNFYGHMGAS